MIKTKTLTNGQLSAAQRAAYWRDGFLFPLPALSPAHARAARVGLEAIEAEWLDADLPHPLNTYKRVNAHVVLPMAADIALDPGILDVVEGIIGPDILVYSTEFFIKEPRTTQIVTMHQDLTYWGMGAIDGLVTAWVALSPATPASGCMEFVAGSHRQAILPHADSFDPDNLLSRGQEVQVNVPPEDRTPIEIHPGQMSLHHGLTIHGSGPNTGDDRRIACVVRYVRPDTALETGGRDHAMQARGTDNHGNFIHVPRPDADFAPDALALHDEIRRAQAAILMKGAAKQSEIYA